MYWNLEAFAPFSPVRWLTLTWDVLKCLKTNINLLYFKWLTLTWDVLKYARGEATENSDID